MLKQQQQRELSELDRSKHGLATQSEELIAKYHEASERQKRIVSRCHSLILFDGVVCSSTHCPSL